MPSQHTPCAPLEWEAWLRRDGRGGIAPDAILALGALAQDKEGLPMDILWAAPRSLCWAACGLLKTGKGETLPSFTPKLLSPDQGASCESVYPAARVFSRDGCLGAAQGPGCTDLPTDVYWKFACVAKKPGGSRRDAAPGDCPCSGRGSPGSGSPAAWHPQSPAVLLSLAPEPAVP